ncbi:MAG: alpha/beta hydrolase [Clostridia bacterium]|nr:alpha/beta hydrolase [Clostridia bacterium]
MQFYIVLSVLVVAILFLIALSYFKTYSVLSDVILGSAAKSRLNAKNSPDRKHFRVTTRDKLNIAGYIVEPQRNTKGIIVLCHNLGGSKDSMWRYARFLLESGYMVVCFDFRNHGESDSYKKLQFNYIQDLRAIMDYVQKINCRNMPVGIFAMSMGTIASVLHAVNDSNIKALVLDGGPFMHKEDYLEHIAKFKGIKNFVLKKIFNYLCFLITDLSKIERKVKEAFSTLGEKPILFIQAEKDFMNPPRNIETALKIINSHNSDYWLVRGANHLTGYSMEKDEYRRRVVKFFDKNMIHKPSQEVVFEEAGLISV